VKHATLLTGIVRSVERELATVYRFSPRAEASNHLVDRHTIQASLGDAASQLPEWQARGGVWLLGDDPDLFIGIHIDDSVTSTLAAADPLTRLSSDNLDAFCVVVEEVSHFHMIINRASDGRGVSKLELECQGELDKLLVAALLLQRQSGHAHVTALARTLFDAAAVVSQQTGLYEAATRYAARWWYTAATPDAHLAPEALNQLRAQYKAPLAEKLTAPMHLKKAS